MADDQSETVNHRRVNGKKQRLSDSDSDQPAREIFSGDDRKKLRNKFKGS